MGRERGNYNLWWVCKFHEIKVVHYYTASWIMWGMLQRHSSTVAIRLVQGVTADWYEWSGESWFIGKGECRHYDTWEMSGMMREASLRPLEWNQVA